MSKSFGVFFLGMAVGSIAVVMLRQIKIVVSDEEFEELVDRLSNEVGELEKRTAKAARRTSAQR